MHRMTNATIDTHVLDHLSGGGAIGMRVELERRDPGGWTGIGSGVTDADGRERALTPEGVGPGAYRLVFAVGDYYAPRNHDTFFPRVVIEFAIADGGPDRNYHVPLLVTPNWYSTYLGV